jgi:hypothetical protein
MPSKSVVAVYYLDQDRSWMKPCREVSRYAARKLKDIGSGKFVDNGWSFQLSQTTPVPQCEYLEAVNLPPAPLGVAETITFAEIQANVGITSGGEPGLPANRNAVRRAQAKIRAYPTIFDKLAVIARGRWVKTPIQIVVAA